MNHEFATWGIRIGRFPGLLDESDAQEIARGGGRCACLR